MASSLGGSRYRYRLWGDSPKNHGSGVLNDFQTFLQKFCVSMPELDVVLRGGSVVQPDCLANHKRHSLGFGFSYRLGGQGATFALMQHFVSDLMHQRGKFLGGLHPGKQGDLSAKGQAFGGCDPFGVVQRYASGCDELYKPFAVAAHVALHFGQRRQFLAFGLANVLSRDSRPSLCAPDGIRELMYFSMAVKRR